MLEGLTPKAALVLVAPGWPKANLFAVIPADSPNLVENEGALAFPDWFDNCGEVFSPNFFVTVKVGAAGLSPEPEPNLGCGGAAKALFVSGTKKLSPSS